MAFRRVAKEFAPVEPVDLLVVGLGNPGPEWEGSRHNAGADVVRILATRAGVSLGKTRDRAAATTGRFGDLRLGLAVPTTFMNDSGAAVRGLVKRFGVDLDKLLVVTDDMDLAFGRLRLRGGGGTGGHQGLNSVKNHLHSGDFLRLKVGVGRPPGQRNPADHVLGKFSAREREEINVTLEEAADAVLLVAERGLPAAMDRYNRKPDEQGAV